MNQNGFIKGEAIIVPDNKLDADIVTSEFNIKGDYRPAFLEFYGREFTLRIMSMDSYPQAHVDGVSIIRRSVALAAGISEDENRVKFTSHGLTTYQSSALIAQVPTGGWDFDDCEDGNYETYCEHDTDNTMESCLTCDEDFCQHGVNFDIDNCHICDEDEWETIDAHTMSFNAANAEMEEWDKILHP